jgi:adenylyltransferase/sulfurtransferase
MGRTDAELGPEARRRFDRNIRLAAVGEAGQRRLLAARAAIVGAGGLGSAAILYLAAAGVGHLRIIDAERVELSNFNRQILHGDADLGRPKVESARETVLARAPACHVETVPERLTPENAPRLIRGGDVVLDCTDNFPTRFLVADACWRARVPLVSASVLRFEGQLLTVIPAERSPCYRCLLPAPPPPGESPTAADVGILGAVAGALGALQAVEAVKVLLGIGEDFSHRLLVYDGLKGTFRTVRRTRDPACPLCGGS